MMVMIQGSLALILLLAATGLAMNNQTGMAFVMMMIFIGILMNLSDGED